MSSASRRAAAVLVAGGAGRRLGGVSKPLLELLGEPVLLHALRPFLHHPAIVQRVVVLPAALAAHPPAWLAALPVTLVAGGAERGESVWNGLQAVDAAAGLVLVHDAARPLLSRAVVDRVLAAAAHGAVLAALPATDTVQLVDGDGVIVDTPPRERVWLAQTPQAFPLGALLDAYRAARAEGFAATDDAAVYARYAGPVRVVQGSPRNLKLTRPGDLAVLEALALAGPGEADE